MKNPVGKVIQKIRGRQSSSGDADFVSDSKNNPSNDGNPQNPSSEFPKTHGVVDEHSSTSFEGRKFNEGGGRTSAYQSHLDKNHPSESKDIVSKFSEMFKSPKKNLCLSILLRKMQKKANL